MYTLLLPEVVVARVAGMSNKGSARIKLETGAWSWKAQPRVRLSTVIVLVVCICFTPACCLCSAAESLRLNVVLISIDTLRADHLGCYGDKQIQTPNIDQLAAEGTRFAKAFTPVPITLPAHAALLTGAFPLATGMHDFIGNKLPASATTLATALLREGYTTAAFVSAAVLDSRFGLNQGFDTYYDHFNLGGADEVHLDSIQRRGDQTMDEALKWLGANPRHPFFLWVHLYDPHTPYDPPEPYASRYRARPYDGEIAFADAQVGRLLSHLKQAGLLPNTVIALVSDHGEGLGEHGEKTHGFFIYNSTLHIAMIIRVPGAAARVVQDGVSLVDVAPTLLQAVGLTAPPDVQGRSLLSLILGRASAGNSNLYAESYPPLLHFGWNPLTGVQWHDWKFIETTRPELYDIHDDPQELHNLFASRQAMAAEMRDRLNDIIRRFTPAGENAAGHNEIADPALMESLRSLGYVAVAGGRITDARGHGLPDPKDRIQVYELISAASLASEHGRYRESLRMLQEAEKTEHNSSALEFLMARNYQSLKEYPRAVEYYRTVLKLNPKDGIAAYYLGVSQLESGDLEGAAGSLARALELSPTNFSAAFDLGVVYTRLQRADAAIQAFQHAVQVLPDFAEAHEALGELYLYQHQTDEAIRELERAVNINPKMAKAHYQLGRAYAAKGLQDKAQKEFDLAK
jgi:arylsulfatase A-like enzyme/Flp pilus assembly protein TadD